MLPPSRSNQQPAVWFPAVKAGTGTDIFTSRLVNGLNARGIRAEITWLPHHAEYAPWAVAIPKPPEWANICHINSWLHHRFHPRNLPIVATVHLCVQDPQLDSYKSPLQRLYHRNWITAVERYSLHVSKRLFAVSHYTAAQVEKSFGISRPCVIHPGIDICEFVPPTRRAMTMHRPFRLLYVSNWSSRKGSDLIGPILHKLGTNFELLYTGQPDKAYLRTLPSNCKSAGSARTTSEIVALYQQADALLFPTRLEGFGLVALEAQACGLPVVATRGSSIVEVVENGVTGILCEQDDVEGFVTAIRKLAAQTEYWKAMSSAARTHAVNQFPEANFIDAHISTYVSLLADKVQN